MRDAAEWYASEEARLKLGSRNVARLAAYDSDAGGLGNTLLFGRLGWDRVSLAGDDSERDRLRLFVGGEIALVGSVGPGDDHELASLNVTTRSTLIDSRDRTTFDGLEVRLGSSFGQQWATNHWHRPRGDDVLPYLELLLDIPMQADRQLRGNRVDARLDLRGSVSMPGFRADLQIGRLFGSDRGWHLSASADAIIGVGKRAIHDTWIVALGPMVEARFYDATATTLTHIAARLEFTHGSGLYFDATIRIAGDLGPTHTISLGFRMMPRY